MEDVRVSTIELFFDLVFVFTITQLTTLLVAEPTGTGIARVVLVFGNVWWMYGGYAWLTNAVPPRGPLVRLLLLAAMGAFLILALAVPDAFGDRGVAFGLAYLAVTLIHTGLFLLSSDVSVAAGMAHLGPFNIATALLLLVAGFTDGGVQWALWSAGFVLHWATPAMTHLTEFSVRSAHFVERHGLIVLITLGESVVAVGIGLEHLDLTIGLVGAALLALALVAGLWWLYFNGDDDRAEQALGAAERRRNPWLALGAFGYAFLLILGGIIVVAAGLRSGIADYDQPVTAPTAWFLAGGVATYALGLALFRRILRIGPTGMRLAIAAVALPTAAIGLHVSSEAQLATLAAIVAVGAASENVSG